jgi:RNA polymerase sigma-70 factor (ECF subfamily)
MGSAMRRLVEALLVCAGTAREALSAHEPLGDTLERWLAEARARWPGIELGDVEFARQVGVRLRDDSDPLQALGRFHGIDVYLAAALERGDRRAVAVFETELVPEVARYVARIDASPAFADDVAQLLRERVLVARPGQPPRIASYRGRGPLGAWMRVMAVHLARDQRRGQRAAAVPLEDAELASPAGSDPEVDYLKVRYRESFRRAFTATLELLSEDERNVLRLYFLDGMTLAAIGRLYRVHEATASRWLARARERLLEETRRSLAKEVGGNTEELTSLLGLVGSRVDVSIRRILGGEG